MVLLSNLIGAYLENIGRKTAIIIGGVIHAMAAVNYGLLVYIKPDKTFFALALANRFFSGVGDAFVNVSVFSVATIEFPEFRDAVVGYCYAGTGFGFLLGPLLGGAIYEKLQYKYTFIFFGGVIAAVTILMVFLMPRSINRKLDNETALPS